MFSLMLFQSPNRPKWAPSSDTFPISDRMGSSFASGEFFSAASLTHFAHENNMVLHVDGARIANAAVGLNKKLREITTDVGVDVLSFGGTKNGMMYGGAVVLFNKQFFDGFKYIRKQGAQLASKMRFISAQFEALLTDDIWSRNAAHANAMAKNLAQRLREIRAVTIDPSGVQANAVFAVLPDKCIELLQREYHFYVRDEAKSFVRFMTSFATTEEEVEKLVAAIRNACSVSD